MRGRRKSSDTESAYARESKHWLRMIAAAAPELKQEARIHWQEAKELHLIFAAIYRGGSKR